MSDRKSFKIAAICASNMNRSMAIHEVLLKQGFYVKSFGTSKKICIPGDGPNLTLLFDFGTTYEEIYNQLKIKNYEVFAKLGLLSLLERNMKIKEKAERFQDHMENFDIIIACDKKVYHNVLDHMDKKTPTDFSTCHVINVNMEDRIDKACKDALFVAHLCMEFKKCKDLDYDIKKIVKKYEKSGKEFSYKLTLN
ncbi:unnamed protein product [Brassicogethes aeneus]|uniref:RNA polymerase II subunit A C-terminal domain phosphatase SSU72 n=1 Tax=Brassicogethes aeneus TaxID=1431903 RepID=A0A9P0B8M1_BRAAE|nr:unnamed protein product [Brassicogethes aeneus]